MEAFHRLANDEKRQAFEVAANQLGLPEYIVEKDFHVTVVLNCLFGPIWKQIKQPGTHNPFIFKGGTTLSKVYGVIDRMSEDVDLALNMAFLGYPEPEQETPNQREKKRFPQLKEAAEHFTQNQLMGMLQAELDKSLKGYSVVVAEDIEDALAVYYTQLCNEYDADAYIKPRVLIETGGRAAQLPNAWHSVKPMVAEVACEADIETRVMVLDIRRTFFEKVTAVHAFIYQNKIAGRSSRHLYDIVKITSAYPDVIADIEMLSDVVEHKKKYFRSGAAKYDLATQGALKLVPVDKEQYKVFADDWDKMQDMFAERPPEFRELIDELRQLERSINYYSSLPIEKICDLLAEHEIGYQLIARIYPLLRSFDICNAHAISLQLCNMRKLISQEHWRGEIQKLLKLCVD